MFLRQSIRTEAASIQAGQRGSLVLREYGYGFSLLNRDNATVTTTHTTSKYDVIRSTSKDPGWLCMHRSVRCSRRPPYVPL